MKTDFENLMFSGVDEKLRRIYFGHPDQSSENYGEVDAGSVASAIKAIHKFSHEAPKKPIELYVNSYGGDAYAVVALIDSILTSPCQIRFIGMGAVMSSAAWIMSVCDHRAVYSRTTILLHDGFDRFEGKNTDIKIEADESFRLQSMLENVLAENSRMPARFWQDVLKRDVYLTAQEALALGLCDEIIEDKKRGNLRQARRHALENGPNKNKISKIVKSIYDRIGLPSFAKEISITVPVDEIDTGLDVEPEINPQETNHK